ncbi:hypothetical protein FHQ89_20295 [Shigella sonnei]|nr:hypothetical protein [Shigella sonnei]
MTKRSGSNTRRRAISRPVRLTAEEDQEIRKRAAVNATMFDRYLPFSCPLNTFVTDAVRFPPFHHH